jgi:hypothetical protein
MTAAVIVSTTVPLNGTAAFDPGPVVDPLPVLNDLSATASFNIPAAEGSFLAAIPAGAKAGSVYTISPNDGRVKIQGGAYVRGPSAYGTAGVTAFTITETFTNTLGQSVSRNSTLTVTAVAPVVVVPGNATVADGVGRKTIAGVKIAQLPAGASLTGTGATHFSVDALGQVTVNTVGAAYTTTATAPNQANGFFGSWTAAVNTGGANGGAGLNASYSLTVVGGGSVTSLAFSTLANEFTATNANEIMASFAALKSALTTDHKIVIPTGTTISSSVKLQGAKFPGLIVDENSNLLPQDINPLGFGPMSGGNAGPSLWGPGFNGKQAYNPNAVATMSGGSLKIYCPTVAGAKIDALMWLSDVTAIHFENLDFCRMSPVDMYDSKPYAPTYVTTEIAGTVTAVNGAGGVVSINWTSLGSGFPPGYILEIWKAPIANNPGNGFSASAKVGPNGAMDLSTFVIKQPGTGHTTATKIDCRWIRIWDPDQRVNGQIPADMPNNRFYQLFINSVTPPNNDTVTADWYPSIIIRKCRFGIGSRNDVPSVLRYNRTVSITSHNRLVVEDCLWDGFWIAMGQTRHVRTDFRRNAFRKYTNDIVDVYPVTPDMDPVASAAATAARKAQDPTFTGTVTVLYTQLPAPFRQELLFIRTDNYTGGPDESNLLFSNSHSDDHQHGGGGDFDPQNLLYANNFINMHCSSTYITTQGYFDNNDNPNPKRGKFTYNFAAASTTNTIVTASTVPSDGIVFERNFSTRTIAGPEDLGGGVDFIGGGINLIKGPQGQIIRRNTIKEVWEMDTGDGGRITSDPPSGIMTKFNAPTVPRNKGPIYISDNFYLSYLTPNTGAGNSYPEIFKGLNAVGQGPAFVWDGTLVSGKPAIGFQHWWDYVRDTPATNSWTDTWAAVARGKADIQSIFTPQSGSGADGRHCFPAASW